jgi:hypothetical protein
MNNARIDKTGGITGIIPQVLGEGIRALKTNGGKESEDSRILWRECPPPTDPQAMKAYDEEMRQYQADMDTWQQEYQNWQEKRSKAIGEAEGTIKATYNDYEQAFKANVRSNWLLLFIITLALFCMVLGVLKWKDRR